MYSFVPNEELHKILAAFHTNLNKWITFINEDIRTTYDEDGYTVNSQYLDEIKTAIAGGLCYL